MTGPLPPPDRSLRACVVVPARDEQDRIAACIDALAAQDGVPRADFEVILVLDRCADATAERALRAAGSHAGLRLRVLAAGGPGPGAARRLGMDAAAGRLEAAGRPRGLIASTDADTCPKHDWLARQLDLLAAGAEAVGGLIEVAAGEAGDEVMRRRAARLEARARAAGAGADAHPFFSGAMASMIGPIVSATSRAGRITDTVPRLRAASSAGSQSAARYVRRAAQSSSRRSAASPWRARPSVRPEVTTRTSRERTIGMP